MFEFLFGSNKTKELEFKIAEMQLVIDGLQKRIDDLEGIDFEAAIETYVDKHINIDDTVYDTVRDVLRNATVSLDI